MSIDAAISITSRIPPRANSTRLCAFRRRRVTSHIVFIAFLSGCRLGAGWVAVQRDRSACTATVAGIRRYHSDIQAGNIGAYAEGTASKPILARRAAID